MTDKKISELVAVTTVEDTDEYVLARAGASNKITGANLKAAVAGGSQTVLSATVTLDNDAIKTLPSVSATPDEGVVIVPSPGDNKLLAFLGGHMVFSFPPGDDTAMYVSDPGEPEDALLLLVFGGGTQHAVSNAINVVFLLGDNFTTATGYRHASLGVTAFPTGALTLDFLRESVTNVDPTDTPPLLLAANGQNIAVQDFTGGNAANTLTVTVFYSVIDLAV